jgi:two-component system alkaline phosphatase synthesis response regulator PhoP
MTKEERQMPKKILVCDDEPYILMALTDAVEMEGYECVTAVNGKEAVERAKEEHPDLILLDVMMPYKDGFEVCRELKDDEMTRDIPIIMLTAKSQQLDIMRGKEVGADDYITKPFKPSTLRKKFNEILEGQRIIDDEEEE